MLCISSRCVIDSTVLCMLRAAFSSDMVGILSLRLRGCR